MSKSKAPMTDNKLKISISIGPKLLRRLDAVADARQQSRSEIIERLVSRGLKSEESLLEDMESPLNRAIVSVLTSSPHLLGGLAKLIGEELEPGDIERVRKQAEIDKANGVKRQRERRLKPAVTDGDDVSLEQEIEPNLKAGRYEPEPG